MLGIKKPEGEAGATWPAIAVGLFVAFGGVLYGYDTGTISGILGMKYWLASFATGGRIGKTNLFSHPVKVASSRRITDSEGNPYITASEDSLIVSILSAGTFFGALLAAPVADILGRRWGLMSCTAIVFNFGVILQTIATRQPMFIAGRFFAGLGVGLISAMIPLYQSEVHCRLSLVALVCSPS